MDPLSFLSKPAVLATVSYIILAFVVMLPLGLNDKEKKSYSLGKRVTIVLLMLIPIALSIYSINCMMVGKCVVWSWVQSIAIALWVLLFVIASLMSNDKLEDEMLKDITLTL